MTTTTTRHEVEVDAAIAAIAVDVQKARRTRASRVDAIHFALGESRVYVSRDKTAWPTTEDAAVAALVAKVETGTFAIPVYRENAVKALASLTAIDEQIAADLARIDTLDDEWRAAGRWSRFFLVTSSDGGHIHRTMNCSTCRMTTEFGWLPNLSGLTEADAVAEHGAILCTVCFPTAPVEWTSGAATAVDETVCTGHRDYEAPSRTGYYTGNWATCTCGQRVSITSTGKVRKHKRA